MHLGPRSIAAVSKKHIFDGKSDATRIYNERRALKWKNSVDIGNEWNFSADFDEGES